MSEEKEKCFLFYERWETQMQRLPDDERLAVYDAVFAYAFRHEVSDLAYYLESILDNIRQTIDGNAEKQAAYVEQRRNAIKSRWAKQRETDGSERDTNNEVRNTEDTSEYERIHNKNKNKEQRTKNKNKEQRTKNKNKEQEKKEAIEESSSEKKPLSIKASLIDSSLPAREEEISEGERKLMEERRETLAKVKAAYNLAVARTNLPMLKKMTEAREGAALARVKDYGLDAVLEVMQKAAGSNFLNGDNDRGFTASFDWIMRPNNFPKVMEGNYDNRKPTITNNTQNGTYPQRQVHNGGRDAYGKIIGAREQRDRDFAVYASAKLASSDPDKIEELPV